MNSHQIEIFITVAQTGSITQASELLYMSPQSVAQQLKKFEQELQFPLFIRSPKGVTLTNEGNRFLEGAQYLNDYSHNLIDECRRIARSSGRLRVGQIPFALHSTDIINLYLHEHDSGQPEFVAVQGADDTVLDAIANGLIDVIEWVDEPAVYKKGLVFEYVCDLKHVCIVNPGNPLAQKESLTVHDLVGHHVLVLRRSWYTSGFQLLDSYNITVDINERPNIGYQDVVLYCSHSENIVIAIEASAHKITDLACIPLTFGDPLRAGLVHRNEASSAIDSYIHMYKRLFK